MVAPLGNDGDADAVAADLRNHGVDVAHLQRGAKSSTYSVILVSREGERMIVTGGVVACRLHLDGDCLSYARTAGAVFTNAYVPDRATRPLLAARDAGALPPLGFDLRTLSELDDRETTPETVDEIDARVDLFVAARWRCDCTSPTTATPAPTSRRPPPCCGSAGVGRAALARGADGAVLLDGDETVRVPAYDVDVADATGAGDAFVAGAGRRVAARRAPGG